MAGVTAYITKGKRGAAAMAGTVHGASRNLGGARPCEQEEFRRLARLARGSFSGAAVHVVVGAKSAFAGPRAGLDVLGPQPSLLPLMERCDACVSAAGTTLYELCALGVPTVAVAIADNQAQNARAFHDRGLGLSFVAGDPDDAIAAGMRRLAGDAALRARLSAAMRGTVPGDGAERIAEVLLS